MGAESSNERDNWNIVQGIGVGAFGAVMAVARANELGGTRVAEKGYHEVKRLGIQMFAMKCIGKRGVIDSDSVKGFSNKRQLIASLYCTPAVLCRDLLHCDVRAVL